MLKQALRDDPLTRLAKRFDSPEFVSARVDGHLRSTLLHALNHPFDAVQDGLLRHRTLAETLRVSGERTEDTLGVIRERSEMPMPDVCVAYSLYRDSGRMINLADWYDAFTQQVSLPISSSRATFADDQQSSRKRPSPASAGGENGQTEGPAGMEARPEDLDQVRFACAVNELASLGLLRRTRRKAEHVLKTIWDLPPAPSFGHVPDTG
ncbi:hypothetical protein IE81DRAFT_109667 [Ceraceosorus guamensis]|uniref:Origin recognition complex subunit 3 winged helix C-terminal domain-containing protein n=1 Tax=Ceraceosorus guamensis TaxID=1522189 RepID=A0A316W5B7_9BASI|nr:hypothetical protein IE81DRAFT_109667 [Ceraceosorus guamensis]PWN42835.1 hypothetical protein IE81DRAFT_109667 [Ceraceosorus guamensis]